MNELTESQIDAAKDLKILKPVDWMTNDVSRTSWYNIVTCVARQTMGDLYTNTDKRSKELTAKFFDIATVPH